jgi:hypothetical protein
LRELGSAAVGLTDGLRLEDLDVSEGVIRIHIKYLAQMDPDAATEMCRAGCPLDF